MAGDSPGGRFDIFLAIVRHPIAEGPPGGGGERRGFSKALGDASRVCLGDEALVLLGSKVVSEKSLKA